VGDKLVVSYRDLENQNTPNKFTNVAVAAFISSWARLKLYETLDAVGIDRLLYCDTDSVTYIRRRDETPLLPIGDYLGQLKNEIKQGWEIRTFISLGPKNYAYREVETTTGKINEVIKIRGITLSQRARKRINFEHMYNLVTEKCDSQVIFTPTHILRKPDFRVVCKPQTKRHAVVQQTKRRRLNPSSTVDYGTLPYGFR